MAMKPIRGNSVLLSNSHKVLLLLLISFLISGVIDGAFPQFVDANFLLHTLLIGILLAVWCACHADDNNIEPPRGAKLLCFLIGFIGVPFYLFRAFGFKKGGVKLLIGLAFTVFLFLLNYGTISLTDTIFA